MQLVNLLQLLILSLLTLTPLVIIAQQKWNGITELITNMMTKSIKYALIKTPHHCLMSTLAKQLMTTINVLTQQVYASGWKLYQFALRTKNGSRLKAWLLMLLIGMLTPLS